MPSIFFDFCLYYLPFFIERKDFDLQLVKLFFGISFTVWISVFFSSLTFWLFLFSEGYLLTFPFYIGPLRLLVRLVDFVGVTVFLLGTIGVLGVDKGLLLLFGMPPCGGGVFGG